MTQQTEQAEAGDTLPTFWTPEQAAPALEALLFPAEQADTNEETEPSPDPEAPATEGGEPEAAPDASAADEGESGESHGETEASEPQPPRFRVKIDDAEEEVTEDELVKGYQRQADYTRKTQKLAEERKAFEAEQAALRERAERYAQNLHLLEQALQPAPAPKPEDYPEPQAFAAAFAQWQHGEIQRKAVAAEREQAVKDVTEQRSREMAAQLAAERAKLLDAAPDLHDETNARKLAAYVKSYGFTDEEIAGVTRHELLVMARKAMLYDEAMKPRPSAAKKQPEVKGGVKVVKPGAAATTKPQKSAAELAAHRLQRTGSVHDAARLFEQFFPEE